MALDSFKCVASATFDAHFISFAGVKRVANLMPKRVSFNFVGMARFLVW